MSTTTRRPPGPPGSHGLRVCSPVTVCRPALVGRLALAAVSPSTEEHRSTTAGVTVTRQKTAQLTGDADLVGTGNGRIAAAQELHADDTLTHSLWSAGVAEMRRSLKTFLDIMFAWFLQ